MKPLQIQQLDQQRAHNVAIADEIAKLRTLPYLNKRGRKRLRKLIQQSHPPNYIANSWRP